MAWRIEFLPQAQKELTKLDRPVAQRILRFLDEQIRPMTDPRSIGEALRGEELGKFWKYRIGDHRLVGRILDDRIVIVVVRVGHRRDVYR